MADRPPAPPPFTTAQKWAISIAGVFFAGLAILGGYGSFAAVQNVARDYGFGDHAWIVPIGVDLGILALLVVDLVLEQLDMPLPPLRWLAWGFTGATIWFNMAAVDPHLPWQERITGQGMHAAMPLLFIAFMEGLRHAVRRRTGMVSNRRMDGIRLSRWLTDPFGTFGIWRRMVLWEVRSYRTALVLEKHRRERVGDLRAQHGFWWRWKAPAKAKWPLRGGMLDLALELTGTTTGTNGASSGGHPALPAPAPGTTAPELAPAPHHMAPAPAGTTTRPSPATSEETGPRPTGTAAAHTHQTGTITMTVPTNTAPDEDHPTETGTTTGDHPHTEGTTPAHPAPATGPGPHHPGTTGPAYDGRPFEMDPAQGTNPRGREASTPPARPDIDDAKMAEARELARGIIRAGSGKVSRRSLKAAGLTGKTELLQEIADVLNEEIANGEFDLGETA